MDITDAIELESDQHYRIMAVMIPANPRYARKILVFAMPGETGECPKVCGTLVIHFAPHQLVEWIEVPEPYRRTGIARRMWRAVERFLGQEIVFFPSTPDGEKLADAMEAKP